MTGTDRYFATAVDEGFERERLRLLGVLTNQTTAGRLDRVGVGRGWRCLEVGAGDGLMAQWLAGRIGPEGRVVATEKVARVHRVVSTALQTWGGIQRTGVISAADHEALQRLYEDPSFSFGPMTMVGAWGRRATEAS